MKCNSCNADIPPSFVRAIEKNICPACENPIMADETIELMAGLKSALEQMPNDPQGIAGWLLSNYRMQKVGTGEPTGFYGVKNKQSKNPNIEHDNLKIAENPMQKFLKSAGINPEKQANYALLAAQINSGKVDDDFSDLEGQDSEDSNYVPESEDPEYTKQALRAMQETSGFKKSKSRKSAEPNFDSNIEELPHPLLAGDRLKRLEAQKDLVFGGSVGVIKRSG